jgi:hypothetical protein
VCVYITNLVVYYRGDGVRVDYFIDFSDFYDMNYFSDIPRKRITQHIRVYSHVYNIVYVYVYILYVHIHRTICQRSYIGLKNEWNLVGAERGYVHDHR